MNQRGFILIARGLLKHPRFKPSGPFTAAEAWLWMIEEAAFKSRTVPVKNGTRHETLQLERGQLSHSIRYLAQAWSWSDKRVQRFLAALVSDQSVTTQTTTLQTVITLCNWDKYQSPFAEATTQATTQTTTQTTTKKKELQRTIDNPRSRAVASEDSFAEWYAAYPRKEQRGAAFRAYSKVIAGGKITHAELIARTKTFAGEWAKRLGRAPGEKQFIPYPASWLNKGAYDDVSGDAPKPSGPAPIKPVAEFDEADWLNCLSFKKRHGQWSSEWGPSPGEPGCLVPSHLIVTAVASKGKAEGL
jgi:hypothetical protein